MDFQLDEDQRALVAALQAILQDHTALPPSAKLNAAYFDHQLQDALVDAGFVDAGREMGPVAAALIIAEAACMPAATELGASALVAPMLFADKPLAGPIAMLDGRSLGKAARYLSVAKTALIDLGEDVAILAVGPGDAEAVESLYAYPYGRFASAPDLTAAPRLPGAGPAMRRWRRVALAAEFAGAAEAAVAFTVDFVKQRHVFGKPVGSFQTVQHRLAQCRQIALGVRWLALRAAWSGEALHADLAACYAQQHVQKLVFDLHQFHGAMGVTKEHLLHFWTYRLRALQAEVGGAHTAALEIANHLWGDGNAAPSRHDAPPFVTAAA